MKNYIFILIAIVAVTVFIIYKNLKQTQSAITSQGSIDFFSYPFQTGDLLLFQNESTVFRTLRLFTASMINHIGLIYIHPLTKHPYVLEMTFKGVAMVPLYAKIKIIKGCVYVRSLQRPLTTDQLKRCDDFVRLHWNDVYMNNVVLHWYNRYLPMVPLPSTHAKNEFTCSTFIASALIHLGILTGTDDKLYPLDFISSHQKLPIDSYGPELLIKIT